MQRLGGADASHANRAALHRSQMVAGLKLPQAYRDGLRSCYWPGRAQVAHLPSLHCLHVHMQTTSTHSTLALFSEACPGPL